MKRSSALFLQVAIVIIGIGGLALLLGEPHLEGRNAYATAVEIYFHDPFLAYVYLGSTPFFFALYRAFGLFGHARKTGTFSPATVQALRTIRNCALALIGFVALGAVFIIIFGDKDDRPAGFFLGFLVALVASVTVTAAAKSDRSLQNALGRTEGGPG